ncbi:MAG: hypothetical protein A3F40_02860 [Chlamydiae bacterium RIFCSPHIGHO2_12_FULL_27_8]|nr:MAG: hypothetical protein A3F40_02860 [Chlamydiae bacterium RIFCSPHIGHO2_12_FULL_27_8]
MKSLDLFTIFFASAAYFVLYLLWYSKFLFKKFYHVKNEKILYKKRDIYYNAFIFISILIMAYTIASFEIILNVTNFKDGITLGFLFWIAIIAPQTLINSYKNKKPLKLFFLDNALYLIGSLMICIVLAG